MSLLCFGQFSYEDCSYINYGPLLYILYIYAVCGGKIMSTFLPSYYWLSLMIMNVTRPAIAGHDIGHWPAGPTAIFSRRASRATSMHFFTGPMGH